MFIYQGVTSEYTYGKGYKDGYDTAKGHTSELDPSVRMDSEKYLGGFRDGFDACKAGRSSKEK